MYFVTKLSISKTRKWNIIITKNNPIGQATLAYFIFIVFFLFLSNRPSNAIQSPSNSVAEALFRTKPGHYDKMFGTFTENERIEMLKLAKETFIFAYDNYMKHAFPADELNPVYCRGRGPDFDDP